MVLHPEKGLKRLSRCDFREEETPAVCLSQIARLL